MKYINQIALLLVLFAILSCDQTQTDSFRKEYVIESTLVARDSLPEVYLTTSMPIDETYSKSRAGVEGATIEIRLLDGEGNIQKVYAYEEVENGKYQPRETGIVKPNRVYELNAVVPEQGGHVLRAHTRVPGELDIKGYTPTAIIYREDSPLTVRASVPDNPDRPNFFINSYQAGWPYYDNMTPYYAGEASDDTLNAYFDYRRLSLGLVNATNYTTNPDHTININFPWKGFAYYGPYRIVVQVLDDNMYDRVRSSNLQLSGSTLPPGQIENVIEHVEGGRGVFGSVATDTVYTYVKKQ